MANVVVQPKKRGASPKELPQVACCSVLKEPVPVGVANELALGFAALSDPVRLRLFNLIAASDSGEVCACELAGPLQKSQPTVSHHLKVLFEAGLVSKERRGTWIWYSINKKKARALRDALK
jgi:ArsR family transcriptional regulator